MPIYEYRCEECGVISDILVRNTQAQASVVCSSCKSTKVSRLISAPGAVMVKGSGMPQGAAPMMCPNRDKCGMQCPG